MKCTIPGANARVLAKAVQSFARIGSELFLEAQPNGLSMRTVNRTKSAFAQILFAPEFFSTYDMSAAVADGSATSSSSEADTDNFANKCKVSMKSCLNVFKNMRHVEHCRISMEAASYKLKFEFQCRMEMQKTHWVSVLEQESLQAVFQTEQMPNRLAAGHKLFDEIVANFPANEEELTLEASDGGLVVKNYVEGATVDRRYMRSLLSMLPDEFESYIIGAETSITFSLRELRAILNFADALNLDMSVNFETAGQPVVFGLSNGDAFETTLVMSTLAPDIYNETRVANQSSTITAAAAPPARRKPRKQSRPNETTDSVDISSANLTAVSETPHIAAPTIDTATTAATEDPDATQLFNFARPAERRRASEPDTSLARGGRPSVAAQRPSLAVPEQLLASGRLVASLPTTVETDSASLLGSDDVFVEFCEESEDLLGGKGNKGGQQKPDRVDDVVEVGDVEDDVIPMSPPPAEQSGRTKRRRMMRVFKTCFESTYDPRRAVADGGQVLAPGSDDEGDVEMR